MFSFSSIKILLMERTNFPDLATCVPAMLTFPRVIPTTDVPSVSMTATAILGKIFATFMPCLGCWFSGSVLSVCIYSFEFESGYCCLGIVNFYYKRTRSSLQNQNISDFLPTVDKMVFQLKSIEKIEAIFYERNPDLVFIEIT